MANNKLIIEVTADMAEALEGIKEVTESANECAEALEKLEKVMGRFTSKGELKDIKVSIVLDRKVIAESIAEHTVDSIQGRVIKGSEIRMSTNEMYVNRMNAWMKEQEARREQIEATIKTSSEIVEQNKIQLEWLDKSLHLAKEEFEVWKKENKEDDNK